MARLFAEVDRLETENDRYAALNTRLNLTVDDLEDVRDDLNGTVADLDDVADALNTTEDRVVVRRAARRGAIRRPVGSLGASIESPGRSFDGPDRSLK